MSDLAGKKVVLDEGTCALAEDVLGQGNSMERLLQALVKYGADIGRSERNVWRKLTNIALVQYPTFDTEKEMLVYDWITKSCIIRVKNRFDTF